MEFITKIINILIPVVVLLVNGAGSISFIAQNNLNLVNKEWKLLEYDCVKSLNIRFPN